MVLFRAKLRAKVLSLSSDDQALFLVDLLRLYRFDPSVYLLSWFSFFGFYLFFFFSGLRVLSFVVGSLLSFHVLFIFVVYFLIFRSLVNKWFR